MQPELRHLDLPLQIREGGDGRTLEGVLMPYDTPTDIGRYIEVFRMGAFTKTLQERGHKIPLLAKHDDRSFPIGRLIEAREEAHGLVGAVRVAKTVRGDEALALANEGLVSFSCGFYPVPGKDVRTGNTVERREVKLAEVSLTSTPAYEGAKVLAIREESPVDYRAILASLDAQNPFANL